MQTITIEYDEIRSTLTARFAEAGLSRDDASKCATIITDSTFDGIHSHGIRRVLPLIESLGTGSIDPAAKPELIHASGSIEVWDGQLRAGPLNADFATGRAIELASNNGVGCVGMINTTHWLRAGTYGWQAVDAGCAIVCWTNTISNMPAWGASDRSAGNNPLVIAVPHSERPIVLDMAMSQYAIGALSLAAERGTSLEVPGGYDADGKLSNNPSDILESNRVLPAGFWKGSGLAIALDALAVLITGGRSTSDFDEMGREHGVTQLFLALDPRRGAAKDTCDELVGRITKAIASATPIDPEKPVRYPGAGTLERRRVNRRDGVEIEASLWSRIADPAK